MLISKPTDICDFWLRPTGKILGKCVQTWPELFLEAFALLTVVQGSATEKPRRKVSEDCGADAFD